MTAPTAYNQLTDFSGYQAANPNTMHSGASLDAEFAAIELTLDETLTNLALIQRSDGLLANASVHPAALTTNTLQLISTNWVIKGAWVTGTAYALNEVVLQSDTLYICVIAHTSGTFSVDLANAKWTAISASSGAVTAALNALTMAADKLPYFTSGTDAALADFTAFARTLLDDATAGDAQTTLGGTTVGKAVFGAASKAAARSAIGAVINTNVQAYHAALAAIAGLSPSNGDVIYRAGGVWTASALASLAGADQLARDNTILNAFQIAENGSLTPFVMANGYVDAFVDETGIDGATSTGETYNAAGDYYSNVGAQVEVDYTGSSNIGDMTSGGGLAAAFDGDLDQGSSAGALAAAPSGYVGKDWGSGNTKNLTGVKIWGSNNNGYAAGSAVSDIYLYGSNSAPSDETDGTLLGTIASNLTDVNNANAQELLTGITGGDYRYHWVAVIPQSSNQTFLAEVEFYEADTPTSMVLVSDTFTAAAAPDELRAIIEHEAIDSITVNTDLTLEFTRDGGTTWTAATLAQIADRGSGVVVFAGTADVSGQPSGTSVEYRIKTFNSKEQRIHKAGILADQQLTV